MDGDDWTGGGNEEGERERDNYSYEDSEQFDEDDMCSMATDEGGSRKDDWDGWDGERERIDDNQLDASLDDLPSTSGMDAATMASFHLSHLHNDSSRSRGKEGKEGRAPSAASTLTLTPSIGGVGKGMKAQSSSFPSLKSFAVKACARHLTFYALEASYNHAQLFRYTLPPGEEGERLKKLSLLNNVTHTIPHDILFSILECSFPEGDDDIRLYCCLANGSVEEFNRGDNLYKSGAVQNVMQLGFLLTADVYPYSASTSLSPSLPYYGDDMGSRRMNKWSKVENGRVKGEGIRGSNVTPFKVSLGIDRCRVISCECECGMIGWCHHIVALCLFRIHQKKEVEYRGTMWDSINELDIRKCRKFSQWLVNELPRKFIPVAQRLLDGLNDKHSIIFECEGAPDPTDGGHEPIARWFMSGDLNEKVANALYKFCQPSPTVHCDVNLLSTPPAIASDWSLMLQPLKSKKPEGIWNLLSIARALFKKRDANATSLLHVITDQVLASTHVLIWWLITSLEKSGQWTHTADRKSNPLMNNYEIPQLCGAALCEEIVSLWRVAALNPALNRKERGKLASIIQTYHKTAVERQCKLIDSMGGRGAKAVHSLNNIFSLLISTTVNGDGLTLSTLTLKFTKESFPGFFPALQACHMQWSACELLSLPPDATFSLDPSISPHLPHNYGVLRRPYTVASITPPSTHYYGYGLVENCGNSKKKKKNKKKKGSSKKSARQHITEELEHFDVDELESCESGQESDMTGSSSRVKKSRSSSNSYDSDLDRLFAVAHTPLDGMELKLARCEALFSHGHTATATAKAAELITHMRGCLPSVVWRYDEILTTNGDSSISNSFPITPSNKKQSVHSYNNRVGGSHPSQYFNTSPHHTAYGGKSGTKYGRNPFSDGIYHTPSNSSVLPPVELPNDKVHSISQKTCDIVERALFLAKQISSYVSHRHSVFRLLIDVLKMPKGAMSTSQLQVKLFHLESEIISILNKMSIDAEELKVIREEGSALARMDLNMNGRSDNIWKGEKEGMGVPPVSLALFLFTSLVSRDNILVREEDDNIALGASLAVLGARHPYAETSFPMLGECLRRQKGDLALRLMRRYKDDSCKLGLILDRLLDPSQHRMYKYHKSNGAYFLERDAILGPVIKRGDRPTMISWLGYLLKKKEKIERVEGTNNDNEKEKKEDNIEPNDVEGINSRRPSLQHSISSYESGGMGGNGGKSSFDESEESAGGDDKSSISTHRSSDEGNDSSFNSHSHSTSLFPSYSKGVVKGYGQRTSAPFTNQNPPRNNKRTRLSPPCEAHSHYMVELSKRILMEAGGDESSPVFIHAPNNHGPHRKLLMSSFLTGLYALGLSNKASSSWTSRTYSTHSGCLSQQALNIGSGALSVMKDTWSLHFTPSEAAALADKAGNLSDPSCIDLGAELALSVLSQTHALSCNEGIRALEQCREKGITFLEKAITAIEEASTREEVFPEILFRASRIWADTVSREDGPPPPPSFPTSTPPSIPPSIPPLAHNPYYHHVAAMMAVAASGEGVGEGSNPSTSFAIGSSPQSHLPMHNLSRGGEFMHPNLSIDPSSHSIHSIHLSHSAPNLIGMNGNVGNVLYTPPPYPSIQLPTKFDARLERIARAQRIGLKAMESMAKRGGDEDKKYSKDPPNSMDIQWLFNLSSHMGTPFILLFCDMCSRTVHSPHLLTHFVMELIKIFPHMPHGSLRLAATSSNRPPQGMGQGKFRSSALSSGWQLPTADLFDRAMESAYEALAHRLKPSLTRLSPIDVEEVLEILTRIYGIFHHCYHPGLSFFKELATHCLKHKAVRSNKELHDHIQEMILYNGGYQYSYQG